MISLKVLIVFLLGVAFCIAEEGNLEGGTVLVKTTNGWIKGSYGERTTEDRKVLYWFRKIPFAEPPVGDLRFEAPVPKRNWTGVLDVRSKPAECIQGSKPPKGSEDCLYLKVYTDKKPNPKNKLPVLVWIYGGAFFAGAADFDDHSPDFLLDQDVIVVAIHYRVGVLGFLTTGDTVAPGNNGIRDQVLALKWIKKDIKNFGGDPENITIFGQSAGAASVAYLLQIEETKGLFSKAILNSGSSLSPWALGRNIPKVTKAIAKDLKINTKSSANILAGLKTVNVEDLQNSAVSKMSSELVTNNPVQGLVFGPVEEPDHKDAIITGKTHQKLSNGEFHHVPLLVGYTSLEGLFDSISGIFRVWLARFDLTPALLVPTDTNIRSVTRAVLGPRIKLEYFGLAPVAGSNKRTMRYISDTQFEKPINEAIHLYSKHTKVYAYRFSYQGALWGRANRTVDGVGHTEDLGYIFDMGYQGSEADYLTRHREVKLWTNFVKSGNPTPKKDSLLQNVIWPANEGSDELQYLDIDKDLSVVSVPNAKKIKFWKRIYNGYGKPPYSTY